MATVIFQTGAGFKIGPGQNIFGPFNIAANTVFEEVIVSVNMSLAQLQDPSLTMTLAFQISTDGGVTWTTTDLMTWAGSAVPTNKAGGWSNPSLGFDSNTVAEYAGNKMQIIAQAPNQLTCQVIVTGQ